MTDQTTSGGVDLTPAPQSSSVVVRLAPPGMVIALGDVTLGSAGPAVILSIDGEQTTGAEIVFRADGGGFESLVQLVGLVQAIGSNLLDHLRESDVGNYTLVRESTRASLRAVLDAHNVTDEVVGSEATLDALLDDLVEVAL